MFICICVVFRVNYVFCVPSVFLFASHHGGFFVLSETDFSFIPIFSDEMMLMLQILSFGGLLNCGLIPRCRGDGIGRVRTPYSYPNIYTYCFYCLLNIKCWDWLCKKLSLQKKIITVKPDWCTVEITLFIFFNFNSLDVFVRETSQHKRC